MVGDVTIKGCDDAYEDYKESALFWYNEEPVSFEDWAEKYYNCSPEEMRKLIFIQSDHSRYATINFIRENFEVIEDEYC